MHKVGFIPVRLGSSRFPGKPLAEINGVPMLHVVYANTVESKELDDVYITTPDQEIMDYCSKNGLNCIQTSDSHERASDRCEEAMHTYEKDNDRVVDIPVMIQGDEPMVTGEMIDGAVSALIESDASAINLMGEIKKKDEWISPNTIKVVVDKNNYAMYMSRAPIPSAHASMSDSENSVYGFKQVCVIPFWRDSLITFSSLQVFENEVRESIDMLRYLENGLKVKMSFTDKKTYPVDTTSDLEKVASLLK
jgi:3-deoxy-manno-octulosonate cytidylyltransferase (CMP-KDO synthetase)